MNNQGLAQLKSLSGKKIGRVFVVCLDRVVKKKSYYYCVCECGNEIIKRSDYLKSYKDQSCGCWKSDKLKERLTTHGQAANGHSPTYKSWHHMMQRCLNKNNDGYYNYGGRGVTVSNDWRKFENFHRDMGDRPEGKTLDRINNQGGYSKENCRWADINQQNNNRRPWYVNRPLDSWPKTPLAEIWKKKITL